MLRATVLLTTVIAAALSAIGAPQGSPKRKIPYKTQEIASTCYWTHGRLSAYNGTPTMRLWKIGTKRILSIHSGPGFKRGDQEENGDPDMPANLYPAFKPFETVIFGDFEVCPLEPEHPGEMQDVCIEAAQNIVVGK